VEICNYDTIRDDAITRRAFSRSFGRNGLGVDVIGCRVSCGAV